MAFPLLDALTPVRRAMLPELLPVVFLTPRTTTGSRGFMLKECNEDGQPDALYR